MKKILLTLSLALANFAWAQFSSGTVNLPATSMTVKLDTTPTIATITLTGDSNSMLGIGFGSTGMATGADGFIYNASASRDYRFNGPGVAPSADPAQDWTETSNTVSGSTRTVVATRSLSGGAGDFAISNAAGTVDIFYARKTGTSLGYHDAGRGYATLTLAGVLSTNETVADSKKMGLYPNPAKAIVNFKNADRIKSIDIYEATGRKVKTVKPDKESINVEDLKSGIYYFEIMLKDGSMSYEKLIKE